MTEMKSPKVAPVLPKYYVIKNTNLFRNVNNGEFWCPFCKKWQPRSEFLYKIYSGKENSCYIAQLITDYKRRHIGFNFLKKIKDTPDKADEISVYYSKKALGRILEDKDCLKFLRKNNIKPEDVIATRDIGTGLSELAKKQLAVKLVWK